MYLVKQQVWGSKWKGEAMFQLRRTDSVKAVGKAVGVAEWGPVRVADQAWRMRVGFRDQDGSRALAPPLPASPPQSSCLSSSVPSAT